MPCIMANARPRCAAAPMTRRVFDYALLGLVPSVEDMAATREGKSGAPIGTQRPAASVPLPGLAAVIGATAPVPGQQLIAARPNP